MERLTRATALAVAVVCLLSGRPAAAEEAAATPPSALLHATPSAGMATIVAEAGAEVVFRALSLLGVNYRFGGNSPDTGLDCSGLVRLVFNDTLGLPLPRRSEEISRVGGAVAPTELQPGDLVFFNTLRRAFSHVGIYIGNNQFVHAPSSGGSIRVESLGSDYWVRRFDGARRLLGADGPGPLARGTGPTAPVPGSTAAAAVPLAAAPDALLSALAPAGRDATATPTLRTTASPAPGLQRPDARPASTLRAAIRTRPVAVPVRAKAEPVAARSGPRQRVPALYVN
jgi:hypothetical protein